MSIALPPLLFEAAVERGNFSLNAAFDADPGITALFGPSGSGKTTILNLVAGLERPTEGKIVIGGETVFDSSTRIDVPPHLRRVGLVFQDAQLFPHLTVDQNLKFGTWFSKPAAETVPAQRVIDGLGIGHILKRRPAKLSGGEKQRVALARALLAGPRILLMDEPLSGLDDDRRDEIMGLIEEIRDRFAVPVLLVTHARDEVRRLASKVVRLSEGRVTAAGPPAKVIPPRSSG